MIAMWPLQTATAGIPLYEDWVWTPSRPSVTSKTGTESADAPQPTSGRLGFDAPVTPQNDP